MLLCVVQDLKAVNRSITPWVIVHGHRPAYATVVDTASVIQAQDQRNSFEDIFVQYGVSCSMRAHLPELPHECRCMKLCASMPGCLPASWLSIHFCAVWTESPECNASRLHVMLMAFGPCKYFVLVIGLLHLQHIFTLRVHTSNKL